MTNPEQPRRRFAPIPIETTFQSVRKISQPTQPRIGPNPELTPEPSPRTPTFPQEPRERRRFHPQLIETSRRSRRVGDHGPATRPADKTDITPYTNHIYSAKPKHGRRKHGFTVGEDEILRHLPSRRETEEEGVKEYLLELAAKEAERQMEEAALAAFPNSRAREGGVAHFYFRDDEEQIMPRPRRKSSNLGMNWWHKHMQDHAILKAHERGDDEVIEDRTSSPILHRTDSDLDKLDFDLPPDPMWTTTKPLVADDKQDSMTELQLALGEANRHAMMQEKARHADPSSLQPVDGGPKLPHTPMSHMSPESGRQNHSPFGRPFVNFRVPHNDLDLLRRHKAASPPMLGKELIFRRCPSPKLTKLETDHPFDHHVLEEQCRDLSGQGGLWRGYCCRSESTGGCIVPPDLHGPEMMVTPYPPSTPREACVCSIESRPISEEPASLWSSGDSSESTSDTGLWSAELRQRSTEPKGLHMLHGLNERLQREKAQAERDEKISQEFGEEFITQVYNYLSLGYPAMARGFDEELSRISRVSIEELRRDDVKQMAIGHMLEMKLEETSEENRCPRWMALKVYITEWARQHPDLDSLDPLAWGVRERRGSWAI
ncbi:hypothetical protein PT974_10786 [Cladobotryum mycophilum]|uniref:Uncharacterized protein n=1 Tax=Cladobotryum mycophilum TaxID=491253 RepID=A0ABR0SAU1_9HYPO